MPNLFRHPTHGLPVRLMGMGDKWTLKQVQGDGNGINRRLLLPGASQTAVTFLLPGRFGRVLTL